MHSSTFLRARWSGLLALCVFALASTGCAKLGKVSGTVKYNGEPLGAGRVIFQKEGSKDIKDTKAAEIEPDGTYKIDAPLGNCKVMVETDYLKDLVIPGAQTGQSAPGAAGGNINMKMTDEQKKAMNEISGGTSDLEKEKKDLQAKKDAYIPIPQEYRAFASTPLSLDVHKGEQEFPVEVKGPPAPKKSKTQ